jgi:hypothetical protein
MARRRYQSGSVFKRGKNWVLRYREDIRNSDGAIERLHRSVVLGELATKKKRRGKPTHSCGISTADTGTLSRA